MALGVLIGYPFGGILYAFSGKSAPFYIISILTLIILGNVLFIFIQSNQYFLGNSFEYNKICVFTVFQLVYMDLQASKCELDVNSTNYTQFLLDPIVVKIVIAIFVSTIAMATLEPCLPIWLMSTLKPEVKSKSLTFIFILIFSIFCKFSEKHILL